MVSLLTEVGSIAGFPSSVLAVSHKTRKYETEIERPRWVRKELRNAVDNLRSARGAVAVGSRDVVYPWRIHPSPVDSRHRNAVDPANPGTQCCLMRSEHETPDFSETLGRQKSKSVTRCNGCTLSEIANKV